MVFGVFTFWPLQSRQWLLKRRLWTTWGVWEATCGRSSERLGANLALQKRLGAVLGPSWQRLGVSWGAFLYPKSVQNHVFYDGFWHFRVSATFASKNDLLRALGGDLGRLGSLLGASWGLL